MQRGRRLGEDAARAASAARCASAAPRRAGRRRDTRASRRRGRRRRAGARAAAAISGKRSVTSSSPRDQRKTSPARRTICARMPSHFHSASHSSRGPSASTVVLQRRGQEERIRAGTRRSPPAGRCAGRAKNSAVGVQSPITRCAMTAGGDARDLGQRAHHEGGGHADAELAGDDLVEDEALRASSSSHHDEHGRPLRAGVHLPSTGGSRSSIQRANGRSLARARPRRPVLDQERHRLREVADRGVAVLEQPLRAAR